MIQKTNHFDAGQGKFLLLLIAAFIMFSFISCKNTSSGKLPQYVDVIRSAYADSTQFNPEQGQEDWKLYQNNPVIITGGKGEWDAGALGSMSVIKLRDTLHIYYEAWGSRTDSGALTEYLTLQIGHATSINGIDWIKDTLNPVIHKGASGEWDQDGTWDPFVLFEDNKYKMWYGGGADSHCNWGYAESVDAIHFTKKGQISHLGNVEDGHIVHDIKNSKYYMYYWDRKFEPMGLFRSESINETDFDFENAVNIKIEGEKYPGMYKFTHVILENGSWIMFYSNFLRPDCPDATVRLATSNDGINWTSQNNNLLRGMDGEVIQIDTELYLMYFGPQGFFDAKDCNIRLAAYAGKLTDLYSNK